MLLSFKTVVNHVCKLALALLLLLLCPLAILAKEQNYAVAQWQIDGNFERIMINVSKSLDKKQLSTLKSGFSTFSRLVVILEPKESEASELFQMACTVKFDFWEEKFELVRLESDPKAIIVDSFDEYSKSCLTAEITSTHAIELIMSGRAKIKTTLQIEQISIEKASKIKDWLISQQSGMMKGLFTHMLDDMTQSNTKRSP